MRTRAVWGPCLRWSSRTSAQGRCNPELHDVKVSSWRKSLPSMLYSMRPASGPEAMKRPRSAADKAELKSRAGLRSYERGTLLQKPLRVPFLSRGFPCFFQRESVQDFGFHDIAEATIGVTLRLNHRWSVCVPGGLEHGFSKSGMRADVQYCWRRVDGRTRTDADL